MSPSERYLVPCPACNRHVMNDEGACPFCATPLPAWTHEPPRATPRGRLGRAAILAAGAGATLLSACSSTVVEYGTPVLLDARSLSDGAGDGVGGRDAGASGGAGGTGDGTGGARARPDAGSVVPLYGAPTRDGG